MGQVRAGADRAALLTREARRAYEAERERTEQRVHALLAVLNVARSKRHGGLPGRRVDALNRLREATRLARELNLPPETFRELRDEALACLPCST